MKQSQMSWTNQILVGKHSFIDLIYHSHVCAYNCRHLRELIIASSPRRRTKSTSKLPFTTNKNQVTADKEIVSIIPVDSRHPRSVSYVKEQKPLNHGPLRF